MIKLNLLLLPFILLLSVELRASEGEKYAPIYNSFKDLSDKAYKNYDLKLLPQLRSLLIESEKAELKPLQARIFLLLGMIKHHYGDYKDSLHLHQSALTIADEVGDPHLSIDVYLEVVHLELALERFKYAQRYIDISNQLAKQLSADDPIIAKIHLWQARTFF